MIGGMEFHHIEMAALLVEAAEPRRMLIGEPPEIQDRRASRFRAQTGKISRVPAAPSRAIASIRARRR